MIRQAFQILTCQESHDHYSQWKTKSESKANYLLDGSHLLAGLVVCDGLKVALRNTQHAFPLLQLLLSFIQQVVLSL